MPFKKSTARGSRKPPGKPSALAAPEPATPAPAAAESSTVRDAPLMVVGVGASAGGLEAFTELLRSLPNDTGMAFVLVQHLDPRHTSLLQELLAPASSMMVIRAADGMRVEPDRVYVIPPNACMTIAHGILHLEERADHSMTIDHFFRSLAADYGSRAIGVVLSGTASDGTLGLKAIKAEGGITFAQDEKSAKYDGMPRSAIMAGCVDFILPPDGIAAELQRLCDHPYVGLLPEADKLPPESEEQFARILVMLRKATGVDFANYKHATIRRRMLRRMALLNIDSLAQYAEFLHRNPPERQALFADILINVTGFFREPATFDALRDKLFPVIFNDRRAEYPVRIWVPGCSTGEEVYSLAITLLEYMRANDIERAIQIFGTDLSDPSLDKARTGLYPESIVSEVSAERLRRFFVKVNGNYQISRAIRDVCIFAHQNLTRDPPFSRLDLISCRNVLIYLGPVLQARAMRFFHYGLKPAGFLVLGQSESIGVATDLFAPVEGKEKIYTKKPLYPKATLELSTFEEPAGPAAGKTAEGPGVDLLKRADQLILAQHSPPAVLIDQDLNVLQFRGRTSEFLEHSAGEPSLNIARMGHAGLAQEIRKLVQSVRKTGNTAVGGPVPVAPDRSGPPMRLSVSPIKDLEGRELAFLVMFERPDAPSAPAGQTSVPKQKARGRGAAASRIGDLEAEVTATKQYLQTVIQEHEAAIEELKSAHEEVQSSNEELQSTNEELLTSKEELQSTNEELNTLNEEMQSRNTELTQINSDLGNLLSSINIPIIMLGADLRIRRVTAQAEKVLGLQPADVGRKVTDFRLRIHCPDLESLFTDAIENLHSRDREVQDLDDRTWLLNIRPYRTIDNKIDGAVMTLYDVTERRQSAEVRYRRLFESARHGIVLVDARTGEILDVNPFTIRLFGFPRAELVGRPIWQVGPLVKTPLTASRLGELRNGDPLRIVLTLHTQSGEPVIAEVMANSYSEGESRLIQFNIREQPSRQISDEEQQAAKVEAVGRLAGNIAHEFNNALTTILGYSDLMLDRAGADPKLREEIGQIRLAGEQAASLTRRLLAFGRREKSQPRVLDVNAIVSEIEQVVRVMLPESVELVLSVDDSPCNVKADPAQLEQVIANLVLNARDAMPDGGRITVQTSHREVDEAFAREHPALVVGDYVVLLVSDTGAGMSIETQSHLFEPFYTTRPKSAGLGLSTVQSIVKEADGHIQAWSELGRGTTFRVYLPRVTAAAESAEVPTQAPVHGSGCILLVEDDPVVRRVTRAILEESGYRVIDARGGPEALRIMAQQGGAIDLLLTSVIMPRMSGRELADRVTSQRPGIKVLYMSGYPDDVLEPHGVLDGKFPLLRKPFQPALLSARVSEALR